MLNKGILKGVRVLGIEQQVAAPFCTMMLADQGAEVIKIERPGVGDSAREMAPILKNPDGETTSGYFMRFNRNKKSVSLNIQEEEGRKILKQLIAKCDIVVENFRPGLMDKLGLGYDVIKEINPGVVYVAISGFGRLPKYQGPYSNKLAYDIVAQAMGGLMHLCGQKDGPPTWLGVAIGDIGTGIYAAYASLLGLIKKQQTGEGEFIDVSMYDCMTALAERAHHVYSFTGQILGRGPDPLIAPWGPFKAKDGYVALIVPTEAMWARFCKAIGREDLLQNEELSSGPARAKHMDMLMPIITEWMADKTTKEVCDLLEAQGLPCGPVQNSEDIFKCEHIKARKMLVKIPDPVMGEVTVVGSPIKMSGVDPVYGPTPKLGEHTESVLSELLGYDEEAIAELRNKNII
jgi:crotonobetainyl-CoA:carnitine CoA-transferase CaiB-like acyl-CoA transferase